MVSMWKTLETGESATLGAEVPGVGVLVAAPGVGMCFVPRARLRALRTPCGGATHQIVREDRNAPPLSSNGLTASQIRAKQPLAPDPGALSYLVFDESDSEY